MKISQVQSTSDDIAVVEPVESDRDKPWEDQRVRIKAGDRSIFLTRPDAQQLASALFQAASTSV